MLSTGLLPLLLGPCILGLLVSGSGKLVWGGEYCHGWANGQQAWHEGFQCPERYDAPEATFCCGSCNLRYCCTTSESRVDQGLCYNEKKMDLMDTKDQARVKNATVPTYLPFLLVASVFVSFVVAGSLLGLCFCRCQNPECESLQSGPLPVQSQLLEAEPSTDTGTPSCHSSSSSNPAVAGSAGGNPQNKVCSLTSENRSLYRSMPARFPSMDCSQGTQYHPSTNVSFKQSPYVKYGVPAERAIVMNITPASLVEERMEYGHLTCTYPAGVIHCDQRMHPRAPL